MEVIFETATIYDLAKKANTIAPTKGAELARAAGTLLEIRPNQNPSVIVKSTNTLVYYLEWSNAISCSGTDDTFWRVPSALFSSLLGSFPLDANSTVSLSVDPASPGLLVVSHLKSKYQIHLMDPNLFPLFQPFDPMALVEAKDFAARFNQVAWAASKDKSLGAVAGVHVDGESLRATDRYRLACVPLVVPVAEPVTLPPEIMAPILKNTRDVRIASSNGHFYMMPDENSQITSVTIDGAFPKMKPQTLPETIQLNIINIKAAVDRMMLLVGGSERYPKLSMTVGNEVIKLDLTADQVGTAHDEIPIPGTALHDDYTMNFLPRILLDALTNGLGDVVSFSYDPTTARCMPYIQGQQGYEAWVSPRAEQNPGE